jgi:hypothetical protein
VKYAFRNQDAYEIVSDMTRFLEALRASNPAAQVILTVSPVPLMATATPNAHVLTATTYSKSALRVAAEMVTRAHDGVHYFPSYEIITGAHARGGYFADDLRNVTEEGVAHVMRLLMRHAAGMELADADERGAFREVHAATDDSTAMARRFLEVECDEVALDRD